VTASAASALTWSYLGLVGYRDAIARLEDQRGRLLAGDAEASHLFLCEHPPVITLGRNARPEHVLASADELARRGVEVVSSSRGGDVTYHGPGQLMVYPVVRLRRGLVDYLERLAGALAELAAELGVPGAGWRRDPAGLWLGDRKLAACGIHLRRGVAIHGFAFNLSTPSEAWQAIVPCGLSDARAVSIADVAGHAPDAATASARAAALVVAALS
jgi:lipoyl(octanoyl) transferase